MSLLPRPGLHTARFITVDAMVIEPEAEITGTAGVGCQTSFSAVWKSTFLSSAAQLLKVASGLVAEIGNFRKLTQRTPRRSPAASLISQTRSIAVVLRRCLSGARAIGACTDRL